MDIRAAWLRKEYETRVNRAVDFAYANSGREFDLAEMADAACFSRFHFHRLFLAMTGETPGEFVKRLRLARAASLLRTDPKSDITGIALGCGFSGSSVFSRAFRDRFGLSPSAFRALSYNEARLVLIRSRGGSKLDHGGSNDGQAESNQGNASLQDLDYDTGIQFLN
ncbi:MAG: AraC family transcriptional regulator, partial [Spirochaetales bacterium]